MILNVLYNNKTANLLACSSQRVGFGKCAQNAYYFMTMVVILSVNANFSCFSLSTYSIVAVW